MIRKEGMVDSSRFVRFFFYTENEKISKLEQYTRCRIEYELYPALWCFVRVSSIRGNVCTQTNRVQV